MNSAKSDSDSGVDDNSVNSSVEVHSANCWEAADLGDDSRNKKFLRLMGASKKEHHGLFVIGDQEATHAHGRQREQEKHIEEELTEQYEQGMEHRLVGGRRGHLGLGFHAEDSENDEKNEDDKESGAGEKDEGGQQSASEHAGDEDKEDKGEAKDKHEKDDGEERGNEKDERKRGSEQQEEDSESEVKKIKFVKSS